MSPVFHRKTLVSIIVLASAFAAANGFAQAQSSLLKTPSLTTPAQIPVVPLKARFEMSSVSFVGSASNPTGVHTCVKNTGGSTAPIQIGASFTHTDSASGAPTVHFLGVSANLADLPPGKMTCDTNNFSDRQRELFRKCKVVEVTGGVGSSSGLSSPVRSIRPECGRIISPQLPASVPIRPQDFNYPKDLPPQPPVGPGPFPGPKKP
jgi:hypothetical protein